MGQKLLRSREHKIISGVCGGLGEYFDVDPIIFRFVFIALLLAGGSSIIIYLILLIVIPKAPHTSYSNNHTPRPDTNTQFDNFQEADLSPSANDNSNNIVFGLLLISGGALLLLNNIVPVFNIEKLWPAILIIIGLGLLFRKPKKTDNTLL